jgi:energy-coupling factor transport system permease protein
VLICIGAANSLASPARLLKALPGALYEAGVAVSVAVSFAPQAVASLGRVRRARRLRGRRDRGIAALRGMAVPVLEGALERSVDLAAAMDARGFGRSGDLPRRARRIAGALTTTGLVALCAGTYGLLATGAPGALGGPLVLIGATTAIAGFAIGSRTSGRSRYRPDPWQRPEWLVAGCGSAVATAYVIAVHVGTSGIDPMSQPLSTPAVPLGLLALTFLSALPAWLAPPVPRAVQTWAGTTRPREHELAGVGR